MNIIERNGLNKNEVLTLIIDRHYFAEIVLGKKTIEYREIKPYYKKLILNKEQTHYKELYYIRFINGYSKDAPVMLVELLNIEEDGKYFNLKISKPFDIENPDSIIEYCKSTI